MPSPLTREQQEYVDRKVKDIVRETLKASKYITFTGPFGFGKEVIRHYVLSKLSAGRTDFTWGAGWSADIPGLTPTDLPIPVQHKEFRINRRHLEASRTEGTPLDVSSASLAAYEVARQIDAIAFKGFAADGTNFDINGLFAGAGNARTAAGDWGTAANILTDCKAMRKLLMEDNIDPPYALILHVDQWDELDALISNTSEFYRKLIVNILGGGVIDFTASLATSQGLMIPIANQAFFEVAVGASVSTETDELPLDQGRDCFGVSYSCVVPRIFQSVAICKITGH